MCDRCESPGSASLLLGQYEMDSQPQITSLLLQRHTLGTAMPCGIHGARHAQEAKSLSCHGHQEWKCLCACISGCLSGALIDHTQASTFIYSRSAASASSRSLHWQLALCLLTQLPHRYAPCLHCCQEALPPRPLQSCCLMPLHCLHITQTSG